MTAEYSNGHRMYRFLPLGARHNVLMGLAADHPVSLFHPEGTYLKGLVLAME